MAEDKFSFKHVFTSANPGLLDDFYTVDKKLLGEGSYGKVQMGRHKATGAQRAIKSIDIAKIRDKDRFKQETDIQMNLDHPNIVKLYETFIDARRVYLVMELCTGGELFDRIVEEADKHEGSAFGEKDVARYMQQILGAMRYLHSKSYAHRDIKPENFLLQNRTREAEIKVIDFGSSCFVDDQLTSYLQSRSYRAPEVMLGLPYDQKIDLWSLGCIVAELWTGYVLFQNDSVQSLLARIVGIIGPFPEHMMAMGRYVPQYFTQDGQLYKELEPYPGPHNTQKRRLHLLLPKQSSLRQRMRIEDDCFIDFLTQLLQVDPAKRPTATEALAHPWLQPGRYCDGY
mmetsp:Transcript_37036/g.78555  ORF Transcript_37036/g.78555 Transcript_37036/m.78555 type:complete len:342 (-) Transcript_37036:60-1085(-)